MAADMFLKLDDIKGEARDATHKDEIQVVNWSWGMNQSGSMHTGTGGGSGKVKVNDLTFTKHVDKSSPNLIMACCTGRHFKESTLTIRKAGDKPLEYLKIKMKDVLVSFVSTGGGGGED